MTGLEIKKAIYAARENRREEQMKRMEDYNREIYHPEMKRLQELCEHAELGGIENNGIGVYWRECIFCEKRFFLKD